MAIDHDLVCARDLGLDEVRRRRAIPDAIGADWNPAQALAEEQWAHRMLYSGLDRVQQRTRVPARECCRTGPTRELPIDPDADFSRRAWMRCTYCAHGAGCRDCEDSRNCSTHWQYLLSNDGPLAFLQCPSCTQLWKFDAITPRRRAA